MANMFSMSNLKDREHKNRLESFIQARQSKEHTNLRGKIKQRQHKTNREAENTGCNLRPVLNVLNKIEKSISKASLFIDSYIPKILKNFPYLLYGINFIFFIVVIFILVLLIVNFIAYILSFFGIYFSPLSWIPSGNIFYWLLSIFKLILNILLLTCVIFGLPSLLKAFNKRQNSDSLFLTIVIAILSVPWLFMLIGLIIGNGLLTGLYKRVCENKKTNVANFVYTIDFFLLIILVVSLVFQFLLRFLNCSSSLYIHKVLMISSLIYFIYRLIAYVIEKIVSESLFFLLGDEVESNEDCYKEQKEENKSLDALKKVLMSLLSLFLWPLIFGLVIIQSAPLPLIIAPLMQVNNNIVYGLFLGVQKVKDRIL